MNLRRRWLRCSSACSNILRNWIRNVLYRNKKKFGTEKFTGFSMQFILKDRGFSGSGLKDLVSMIRVPNPGKRRKNALPCSLHAYLTCSTLIFNTYKKSDTNPTRTIIFTEEDCEKIHQAEFRMYPGGGGLKWKQPSILNQNSARRLKVFYDNFSIFPPVREWVTLL